MSDWKKFIKEEAQSEVIEIIDPILNKPLSKEDILLQRLTDTYIDLHQSYKEPAIYLGIICPYTGSVARICTPANISAITGRAKSKKSYLQSIFIASAVKNGIIKNKVSANLPKDKEHIILLDTEQSKYDVSRVGKRISIMLGYVPENLSIYTLRGMAANEIIELLEFALKIYPNTGMIFIDQVADLAKSINSEEEAVQIVKWLEKISKENDIHICCVIHQNKGDSNATGWLGSQIMKKAETIISVEKEEKNKDISHIKPSLSRSKDFEEFSIIISSDGQPEILNETERKEYEENEF